MNKELVIVQKTKVSNFPPLMAAIEQLCEKGIDIILICGNERPEAMPFIQKYCKKVIILNILDAKNKLEKPIVWWRIRRNVWKTIKDEQLLGKTFYIPTADTVLAMGHRTLKLDYILNLYELYDGAPAYYLKNLKKYVVKAKFVTCPDLTRAHILRVWHNLSKTPFVIPNRPLNRPTFKGELSKEVCNILKSIEGKKIIQYQGIIGYNRDLEPICNVVKDLPDFVLLLMGRETEYLKKLLKISDNIKYIPFIVPPMHLKVTQNCRIGFLSYDHSCLNNIFCAPNKIWEYSSMGIPMLGNDIPGLKNVIEPAQMGICVDNLDRNQIREAILTIDANYEFFSKKSYSFFDSVSMPKLFEEFIKHI